MSVRNAHLPKKTLIPIGARLSEKANQMAKDSDEADRRRGEEKNRENNTFSE
jgi:hypothetical protein